MSGIRYESIHHSISLTDTITVAHAVCVQYVSFNMRFYCALITYAHNTLCLQCESLPCLITV